MQSFLVWWQHIPRNLSPVALEIGSVAIYWYALFFLLGSFLVYWLAREPYQNSQIFTKEQYQDFAFGIFVSAILGGKLGFLLLYWWPFSFSQNGLSLPQSSMSLLALPGMSFLGGLLAVTGFIAWYTKRHKKNFFAATDVLALYIPIAIFFVRLGSFVHGELFGRVTQKPWGMYFLGERVLRHPSTLYAAVLEGILLFSILFFLRKQNARKEFITGVMTAYFCIFYGTLRFFAEFFREPDAQIGYIGMFTINQVISFGILAAGLILLTFLKKRSII